MKIQPMYQNSLWSFVIILIFIIFTLILFVIFPNQGKEYSRDVLIVKFSHSEKIYKASFLGNNASCAYNLFEGVKNSTGNSNRALGSIVVSDRLIYLRDIEKFEIQEISIEGNKTCDRPTGSLVKSSNRGE